MIKQQFHHALVLTKGAHFPEAAKDIRACAESLAAFLNEKNVRADFFSNEDELAQSDKKEQADLAIAIGGDGTMLSLMTQMAGISIPCVGVNMGRLGFLTDISQKTMLSDMGQILNGQFQRESRSLLQYDYQPFSGKNTITGVGLNDIVVHKPSGRMIEYQIRINGTFVTSTRSDGLIISTPTGSTAYSLSAGGPIVHPDLHAFVIVPICPHTLSNRPIVVSGDATIEIIIEPEITGFPDSQARLLCDGKNVTDLAGLDRIFVVSAEQHVEFLRMADHDYYMGLRSKLGWAGRPPR